MGFGSLLGRTLGGGFGGLIGGSKGEDAGRSIGTTLGSFLPFSVGGIVKNKTQKALLHQGELVVPKHLVKKVSKSLKKEIKANGGRNM
jgi:uncharacterized protein YcfJ